MWTFQSRYEGRRERLGVPRGPLPNLAPGLPGLLDYPGVVPLVAKVGQAVVEPPPYGFVLG